MGLLKKIVPSSKTSVLVSIGMMNWQNHGYGLKGHSYMSWGEDPRKDQMPVTLVVTGENNNEKKKKIWQDNSGFSNIPTALNQNCHPLTRDGGGSRGCTHCKQIQVHGLAAQFSPRVLTSRLETVVGKMSPYMKKQSLGLEGERKREVDG